MSTDSTRTLRRAADNRAVLGLCAGLARTLDLPVPAVRLVVVVAALLAPVVVVTAYAAGALIVPRDDGRALLGGTPTDGRDMTLGWGLASVAGVLLLYRWADPIGALESVTADPYTVVRVVGYDNLRLLLSAPILLLALGVGLWLALRRPAPAAAAGTTAEQPTVVMRGPSVASYGIAAVAAILAVTAGLAAVGAVSLTTGAIAAILAATAVGCGVAAIALNGRRGAAVLLGLAVMLAGGTLVTAALPADLRGRIGNRTIEVSSLDRSTSFRQGIGDLELDLRDVDFPDGPTRVYADVGYGSLTVRVPEGVRIQSTGPTFVEGVSYRPPSKRYKGPELLLQANVVHGGRAFALQDGG